MIRSWSTGLNVLKRSFLNNNQSVWPRFLIAFNICIAVPFKYDETATICIGCIRLHFPHHFFHFSPWSCGLFNSAHSIFEISIKFCIDYKKKFPKKILFDPLSRIFQRVLYDHYYKHFVDCAQPFDDEVQFLKASLRLTFWKVHSGFHQDSELVCSL